MVGVWGDMDSSTNSTRTCSPIQDREHGESTQNTVARAQAAGANGNEAGDTSEDLEEPASIGIAPVTAGGSQRRCMLINVLLAKRSVN